MGSLGWNSALASSFYRFWDLPQPPVCPWVRARVLPLPVSVSACPFAFVSNGQSLIGRAGSCFYPDDLLLSKFSTGWKRGWMCQKSSALLGRKGIWVDPRCRVLSDSQFVHQVCGRWCNKPGPGQTTSCTFGGTDPGCGIWQFSQEETIWLILSKGRGRGKAGRSCRLYTPQVLQFRKEQSEIQGWFSKRRRLWTPFSKNTCLPKALFLSILSEKQTSVLLNSSKHSITANFQLTWCYKLLSGYKLSFALPFLFSFINDQETNRPSDVMACGTSRQKLRIKVVGGGWAGSIVSPLPKERLNCPFF